jgi:hypothetical protein
MAFAGQKCSIESTGMNVEDPAVHFMRNKHYPLNGTGLSLEPEYLVTGSHSGYQALNLAVLAGAKTVILLGFDAREPDTGKPSHWFGDHPVKEAVEAFAKYRSAFSRAAGEIKKAGVTVLNATPGSAITTFPKVSLEDALAWRSETA